MEAQYFESQPKNENVLIKILTIVGIVLMLALILYIFVAMQNTMKSTKYIGTSGNENTIMISETGTVYSVPTVAQVTFTVLTTDVTINDAIRKNSEKVGKIVSFLKVQNVNDEDMKTIDYSVYPKYEWMTKGVDINTYPYGKRAIVGYEAVESIEVKIRNQEQLGRDIQGAIDYGASQVGNLQFIVDNEEDLKKQARELAIKKAGEKAQEIASKLGVQVGDVLSFTESYYSPLASLNQRATSGIGNNMEIVVGEQKVEVTVNVSYEIK